MCTYMYKRGNAVKLMVDITYTTDDKKKKKNEILP